jgi:hypothetical protein
MEKVSTFIVCGEFLRRFRNGFGDQSVIKVHKARRVVDGAIHSDAGQMRSPTIRLHRNIQVACHWRVVLLIQQNQCVIRRFGTVIFRSHFRQQA